MGIRVEQKQYPERKNIIYFFLFFGPCHLGLARNEARMSFFCFLNFFGNAPTQVRQKKYIERIFFFSFLDMTLPGFNRNEAKMTFFNFSNFLGNAIARVREKRYLKWIFFLPFFILSGPSLIRNEARIRDRKSVV